MDKQSLDCPQLLINEVAAKIKITKQRFELKSRKQIQSQKHAHNVHHKLFFFLISIVKSKMFFQKHLKTNFFSTI